MKENTWYEVIHPTQIRIPIDSKTNHVLYLSISEQIFIKAIIDSDIIFLAPNKKQYKTYKDKIDTSCLKEIKKENTLKLNDEAKTTIFKTPNYLFDYNKLESMMAQIILGYGDRLYLYYETTEEKNKDLDRILKFISDSVK